MQLDTFVSHGSRRRGASSWGGARPASFLVLALAAACGAGTSAPNDGLADASAGVGGRSGAGARGGAAGTASAGTAGRQDAPSAGGGAGSPSGADTRPDANQGGRDAGADAAAITDGATITDGAAATDTAKPSATAFVYVGSNFYNAPAGTESALRAFRLDLETGGLTAIGGAVRTDDYPSFLASDPERGVLYVNLETTSALAAWKVDRTTGALGAPLGKVGSKGGSGSAYVSVNLATRLAFQAHYGSGGLSVYALAADGAVGDVTDAKSHGATARCHAVAADRTGAFLFVPNTGLGTVSQYEVDARTGKLTANQPASLAAGQGPRHIAVHPNGRFVFVNTEQGNTVATYALDGATGLLSRVGDELTTLEAGTTSSSSADLRLHPSGKFLYVVNRGDATIAIFTVDPATGKLTAAGHAASGGRGPRNLAFDPTGRVLVAGNIESNQLVVFRIDMATGKLTPLGTPHAVPGPTGLEVLSAP